MWEKLKKLVVEQVLWAEQHLKGKSGDEKRKTIVEKLCDLVDVPMIPEFVERPAKRWVFGYLIDLACEKLNWLTDWAFGDVALSDSQTAAVAECLEAPVPKLAASMRAATVDERLAELCNQYKVVPIAEASVEDPEAPLETVAVIPSADDFERSISFSLKWEGAKNYTGNANGKYVMKNPADKGGPTNMGIVKGTLAAAHAQGLVPHNDLDILTQAEAKRIYRKNYWDRYGWGELAWPVCLCALDCSINHGGFAWILQRACVRLGSKIAVDGKYGPKTREALLSALNATALAQAIADERKAYYDKIVANDPGQKANLKGWCNRLRGMAEAAGLKSPV